jgi:glycine oxidase
MMRIAVLGGGVIGLSVAWRLADSGHRVELYDDNPGQGASHAGAGMLAPAGESWFGEEDLTRLGIAGLRQWPDFAARLEAASGVDVGLRREGTLLVGVDDADAATLDQVHELLGRHGIEAERLTQRELRRIEPAATPGLRRSIRLRGDLSVHNRRVVRALLTAADRAGVVVHRTRADLTDGGVAIRPTGDRAGATEPAAPRPADPRLNARPADVVVVAAGAELGAVGGLPDAVASAVRPVKGQILRLRTDPGLIEHTVRGLVRGDPAYVVPRADGELVVGATSEEQGHDVRVTADGVYELLRRGIALVPGLREAELVEAIARARPGTPDNVPLIGPIGEGVVVAAGHYRAGFLLAPITAEAIAAYVDGQPAPEAVGCCDPDRFGFAPSRLVSGAANQPAGRKTGKAREAP